MPPKIPTVTLNNGVEMPVLGFGVYQIPAEQTEQAVSDALAVRGLLYADRLVDLIDHNEIVPAVDQVETHPFFQRTADQRLMRERGVQIESWGPFAEGRNDLFSDPALTENLEVFDFELTGDQMARIAEKDTGESLFFSHRDPEIVSQIGSRRLG